MNCAGIDKDYSRYNQVKEIKPARLFSYKTVDD